MLKKLLNYVPSVLVLIIYFVCFGTAQVTGSSMYPTYNNGDFLLIAKLEQVEYGDIIAINSDVLNKFLCKRVIGLGGDHIVINNDGLYRNDELVEESYIESVDWYLSSKSVDVIVPDNYIFVLGDNRNASTDSREIGCLNSKDLYGVSILNITKRFGLNRKDLIRVLEIIFIFIIVIATFIKRNSLMEEG